MKSKGGNTNKSCGIVFITSVISIMILLLLCLKFLGSQGGFWNDVSDFCGKTFFFLSILLIIVAFLLIGSFATYKLSNKKICNLVMIAFLILGMFLGTKFYQYTNIWHYHYTWNTSFKQCDSFNTPEDGYYFITKWGSHYHCDSDCKAIKGKQLASIPEEIATEYREACSYCFANRVYRHSDVYITPYGTHFHSTPDCRWIKGHFVKAIKLNDLWDMENESEVFYEPCKTCIPWQE
jgi:hypothetical protein